jgi:hypothetical protein
VKEARALPSFQSPKKGKEDMTIEDWLGSNHEKLHLLMQPVSVG